jgi:ABC-type multidrug transport system ATPase subunit
VIEVKNVSKKYGKNTALDDISFVVIKAKFWDS